LLSCQLTDRRQDTIRITSQEEYITRDITSTVEYDIVDMMDRITYPGILSLRVVIEVYDTEIFVFVGDIL